VVLEAELVEGGVDPRGPLLAASRSGHAERGRVAQGAAEAELAVEHVVLGHEGDAVAAPGRGQVLAVEAELALVEGETAGERPGQRRLAGPGRTDHGDEPPALDAEAHVVEQDAPAGHVGGDPDDLEEGHGIGVEGVLAMAAPAPDRRAMGGFRHVRDHRQKPPASPWAVRPVLPSARG
jgi:hypothetical protein